MEIITNPHDKLFKETWSDRETAQDFLRQYLPREILRLIKLDTLEIAKDSFVDQELQDYFSDLLYKVKFTGKDGYVYLLFEHKSYPDRLIHLQLLEYMLKIWRLHLKQQQKKRTDKKRLPIILPMVLYHGDQTWMVATSFAEMFAGPREVLKDYIPDFRYLLYDLTDYADDEIKGLVLTRVVLLVFKHIHDPDITHRLPAILSLLQSVLEQESGLRCLEMVLRYVVSATEKITSNEITTIMEQTLSKKGGRVVMTLAQQWLNEGEQKGRQEGYEQGLIEAIELGISLKFGDQKVRELMTPIREIHDLTKLQAIKEAVKRAQDIKELQAFIERSN